MAPDRELANTFLIRAKAIMNDPGGFDFRAALDLAKEVANSGLGFGTRAPANMAAAAFEWVIGRHHTEVDEIGARNTFTSLIMALERVANPVDDQTDK